MMKMMNHPDWNCKMLLLLLLLLLFHQQTTLRLRRHHHLSYFLPTGSHRHRQSFTRLSFILRLTYPNLTNILYIHCWQCRMQCHFIQQAIQCGWKEDKCHTSSRLNYQIKIGKGGGTSPWYIIQIDKDGNYPLSPIGCKSSPIFIAYIECIKMLQVLLTW